MRTSSEVFAMMRKDYGDDYKYLIDSVEKDGHGIMVPALVSYCPISEGDGVISFNFSNKDITARINEVDKFCFAYRRGMSSAQFLSAYDCAGIAMDDYTFWESVVEDRPEENGQSKILISTLLPLLKSEPELHLLVIGSSTENTMNAGRSYDMLIDYLTTAGYKGSMYLIDPYERETEFTYGNFVVKCSRRKYDYNGKSLLSPTGHEFTHVYDDVWVPTLTADYHDDIEYDSINIQLVDGTSKFAYRIDNGTLVLKNNLRKHKDLIGALGGGYMMKRDKWITISGTSTGVGPYRRDYVSAALSEYKVDFVPITYMRGRLTYDPNANLFKQYPKARISTKFFGEDYERPETSVIMEQTWYRGLERRLITNMPVCMPDARVGCGCEHCLRYDLIISNFNVHSKVQRDTIVRGMLTRVIQDKCISTSGATFNNVCGRWVTAARLYASYEQAIQVIVKTCDVTYELAERAYRYLRNNKKIDVRGCKVYSHPYAKYTWARDEFNPTRYYIPGKPEEGYIVRTSTGYCVYDVYGNNITKELREKVLDYRIGAIDQNADEVVNYFSKKYGHLFSYIDGYDVELSGNRPCGFSSDFYYGIVRDYGKYIPIETDRKSVV